MKQEVIPVMLATEEEYSRIVVIDNMLAYSDPKECLLGFKSGGLGEDWFDKNVKG